MALALATISVLTAPTTRANDIPAEMQPGFTIRLTLVDFMIVQRALMTMPDEKAPGVLDRIRAQVLKQVRPLGH